MVADWLRHLATDPVMSLVFGMSRAPIATSRFHIDTYRDISLTVAEYRRHVVDRRVVS